MLWLIALFGYFERYMLRKIGQNSVMKEATGNLLYIIDNVCVVKGNFKLNNFLNNQV